MHIHLNRYTYARCESYPNSYQSGGIDSGEGLVRAFAREDRPAQIDALVAKANEIDVMIFGSVMTRQYLRGAVLRFTRRWLI